MRKGGLKVNDKLKQQQQNEEKKTKYKNGTAKGNKNEKS